MSKRTRRIWLHGLVAAFIGGAATTLGMIASNAIVDGQVIIEVKRLALASLFNGLMMAGAYLKQSPLPPLEEEDTLPEKR